MTNVTAQMVKELREMTGAGMMDCKAALGESAGDMNAAVDWLRAKGLAKAAKKAGRTAAEGLVGVATRGGAGAVVEINSETDFVARNELFQELVSRTAALALETGGDVEKLAAAPFPGAGVSVADHVQALVGKIGENMSLRRAGAISAEPGVVAAYVHNQVEPGLGKIGVLVALRSSGDAGKLEALGRQIAMHVAATNPVALDAGSVDPATIERERAIYAEQARESGKPENIIEKMVEGRVRKFLEESVLVQQVFVIDGETRITDVLKKAASDIGAPVEIAGYLRFAVGEGIEKDQSDFAAEVAAATRG